MSEPGHGWKTITPSMGITMKAVVILTSVSLIIGTVLSILSGSFVFPLAIFLFLAFLLFYSRPEIGAALYIFLIITVFNQAALPSIKIPGGRIYIYEILLIYLLIITLLRNRDLSWTRSPLTVPLVAFWSVRALSAFYNAALNNSLNGFLVQLSRAELPLLTFFIFLSIMQKDRSKRALLRYLVIGGFGMMVFYLYAAATRNQALLSANVLWLRPDVNIAVDLMPRIVTLGIPIAYPLVFVALALMLSPLSIKIRLGSMALFAVCVAAIVIHGFRGYWYATILSVPVLVLLTRVGKRRAKRRFLPRLIAVAGLTLIVVFFMQYMVNFDVAKYIIDRAITPLNYWDMDFSFTGRIEEVKWSLPLILSRPLLGWGMHFPVNPILSQVNPYWEWSFIHVGYLNFLMTYGFLGLMAFIWLISSYFKYATNMLRQTRETISRAYLIGFMSFTFQLLVVGFTNPGFAETSGIILLSIGFALTATLDKNIAARLDRDQLSYGHQGDHRDPKVDRRAHSGRR